jgi:hypothetical protein
MPSDQPNAKAGQKLTPKAIAKLTKLVRFEPPADVQPKSDTKHGQWVCCDCGEPFQNNAMAGSHRPKSHRMGWWTGLHVEEP